MNSIGNESRHLSVRIDCPVADVYRYASNPTNLPEWAHGLGGAGSVEWIDGRWIAASSPMGRVEIVFAPPNDLGVLDHDVTLPSGETVHNPVRVIAHGSGSEVVFTLRRRPGMTESDFQRDAATVAADLARLREVTGSAGAPLAR
ncbi:SRPBCC family protein [Streptomyces sp. 8K308]|uniref:SRPBCC family protein n=1 Tax=Streptomyces sp. 8K308 TaxID=2530388 RepID=UPI001044B585|nr:SRPBCC family protein [Streptomyces sp. 8K308]TDC13468.1 SRPBCC family protein [Streptomyces sp. 8K308]